MDNKLKQIKYLQSNQKYRVSRQSIKAVKELTAKSGLSPKQARPKTILQGEELNKLLTSNEQLINIGRSIMNKVFEDFTDKTKLMFLCDKKGYVIDIASSPETVQWSFQRGIMLGSCLDYYSMGSCSISMAIYCKSPVVIVGGEHFCDLLKSWSCIAFPIKVNGDTVGYLNISDHVDSDLEKLVALVDIMAELIGERLGIYHRGGKSNIQDDESNSQNGNLNSATDKANFFGKIIVGSKYELTIREIEIIYLIYIGKMHNGISNELNISANTLKTHWRNIYQKMGVTNRKDCIELIDRIIEIEKNRN